MDTKPSEKQNSLEAKQGINSKEFMQCEPICNVFVSESIIDELELNREYVFHMIHMYMKKTTGSNLMSREVAYELYHKYLVDK